MERRPKGLLPKTRVSRLRVRETPRLVLSWTSWRLSRLARKRAKQETHLRMLQLELDWQLLRSKELEQQETQLLHRLQELREAKAFRLQETPQLQETPLQQLLGPPPTRR